MTSHFWVLSTGLVVLLFSKTGRTGGEENIEGG